MCLLYFGLCLKPCVCCMLRLFSNSFEMKHDATGAHLIERMQKNTDIKQRRHLLYKQNRSHSQNCLNTNACCTCLNVAFKRMIVVHCTFDVTSYVFVIQLKLLLAQAHCCTLRVFNPVLATRNAILHFKNDHGTNQQTLL